MPGPDDCVARSSNAQHDASLYASIRLLRDYIAVITLLLEQSQARGEIQCPDIEATALMVISLTESYVLSARVLGHTPPQISRQAPAVAHMILQGIRQPPHEQVS